MSLMVLPIIIRNIEEAKKVFFIDIKAETLDDLCYQLKCALQYSCRYNEFDCVTAGIHTKNDRIFWKMFYRQSNGICTNTVSMNISYMTVSDIGYGFLCIPSVKTKYMVYGEFDKWFDDIKWQPET